MFYFRSLIPILALVSPVLLWAQEPRIAHVPVTCLPMDNHSVIGTETSPQNAFQTARVYFRSNVFGVFYYVDMARTAGAFYAVLPKPEPTSDSVVYYIEAYDARAGAIRTPDYEAFVMADAESCRSQDLEVAVHSGDNPRIVLGSESPGVPATPPGFLEDGIVDSLIPPGPSAGGGVGKKTWIALGAAAAAVSGVAMLSGGSTSEPEVTELPVPTPSTPPVTSVPVAVACFDTHPNPPIINVGERIALDGRCSTPTGALRYFWDLGDGRTREGPFIEPAYNSPGSFPVELVVRMESDASMTDRIVKWIDVRDRGASNTTSGSTTTATARLTASFMSEISGGPRGAVHASLELNERVHVATDNTSPRQIASLGVAGENLAAGFARAPRLEGVLWRFDFSRAEHFESGSLRVELGDVVSIGSQTVVFRLEGTQGQVRFRFRLAR